MKKQNEYNPTVAFHPGETLAEKLDELGIGSKEFAIKSGKPEKTISMILKGKSAITPDMAVLFETALNIPAHFWLNKQRNYDEFIAREKRKTMLQNAVVWAKKFPLNEMKKLGWISGHNKIEEKTAELMSFFGLSSPGAWEDYYLNQELKVAFKISLVHSKEPHAISAWLRKGELTALELEPEQDYSEKSFKEILPSIKALMAQHPDNFLEELQTICLSVGVKVVYTPGLPKAPIYGATRWLNDSPLIQLSYRYNRNDSFWFAFFHEAAHIILHGKKDIFLEKADYSEQDQKKEDEADQFAIQWTLNEEEESEIVRGNNFSDKAIKTYAKKFNTHTGIIVARLQKKKLVKYSFGKWLFKPVKCN